MNDKLRRGWLDLLATTFICGLGIAAVWSLCQMALTAGINGTRMALAVGVILAIVLAFTGVKIKDVLFK